MTKQQVLERFCALSSKVMEDHFKCAIPADCFCDINGHTFIEFDEKIIQFIEDAVQEKLNQK